VATVKNAITVTSNAYDENATVRGLITALGNQLASASGKATGLKLESTKGRYGRTKLTAKVTVTQEVY
jgi:hypothetical protein